MVLIACAVRRSMCPRKKSDERRFGGSRMKSDLINAIREYREVKEAVSKLINRHDQERNQLRIKHRQEYEQLKAERMGTFARAKNVMREHLDCKVLMSLIDLL